MFVHEVKIVTFENECEDKFDDFIVQTAELVSNNGDTLYTSWWFDNGKFKTGLQLEWRKKSFDGAEPFRLINVTTSSKSELEIEVRKMLDRDLFR